MRLSEESFSFMCRISINLSFWEYSCILFVIFDVLKDIYYCSCYAEKVNGKHTRSLNSMWTVEHVFLASIEYCQRLNRFLVIYIGLSNSACLHINHFSRGDKTASAVDHKHPPRRHLPLNISSERKYICLLSWKINNT